MTTSAAAPAPATHGLSVDGLTVSFGAVRAVDAVSFTVAPGEVLGVIGPNGSGKTSCFNALCGVVAASGLVRVGAEPVRLGAPGAAHRAGILRVFQAPQAYLELTVVENTMLAVPDRRASGLLGATVGRRALRRRETERRAAALAALDRIGLVDAADRPAGDLTYGQLRMIDLARAVAGRPRVLLLDEPTAGLNDVETEIMVTAITAVAADHPGLAVAIIDHKVPVIDRLCDRVLALELGAVVADDRPGAIWRHPRVLDAYLGGSDARTA